MQPLTCHHGSVAQAEQNAYPQPPAYQQPYPGLQHATQPPVYDAPPLVVNREMVVLEPLRGTHVVIACPHCGHTGPAAVSKARPNKHAAGVLGIQLLFCMPIHH